MKSTLITIALTVTGLVGFNGAGNAAVAPCTENHACFWTGPNFTGDVHDIAGSQASWHSIGISSIDNWDPDSRIAVYYNSQYRGPCFTVAAYGSASDLQAVRFSDGTTADNRMNSHRFNYTCGPVYDF